MLGIGLAFAREALDTRLRSASEVAERLPLPLLARIPTPPRKLRSDERLVMVAQPQGPQAEAFRMLRANLDFVNLDRGARTILVTSALEREGKSTTVANLAVVLRTRRQARRTGRPRPPAAGDPQVLRDRALASGVTSVVLGHLGLDAGAGGGLPAGPRDRRGARNGSSVERRRTAC